MLSPHSRLLFCGDYTAGLRQRLHAAAAFAASTLSRYRGMVDTKYQLLTGHSLDHSVDHNVSSNMDAVKYNLLLNVATGDLDKANLDIEYIEVYISSKDLRSTFKVALDISKENKNKEMLLLFLEKTLTSK